MSIFSYQYLFIGFCIVFVFAEIQIFSFNFYINFHHVVIILILFKLINGRVTGAADC